MKKTISALTGLCALGFAYNASAIDYDGSDTLQNVTEYLVENFDCGDINYLANGSSAGENAMCDNLQESAPMSRALRNYKVCPNAPVDDPDTAEVEGRGVPACQDQTDRDEAGGLVVGWDGLAVARRTVEGATCESLADWQPTLSLLYAGAAPAGGGNPDGSNCGTQERQDLIANWNGLFVEECGGECSGGLRHALRRDDNSGTTGVFEDLVGIDGFCNGAAPGRLNEDNDPIRVDCSDPFSSERYCPDGDLGVVLAISVPDATEDDPAGFEDATNNNRPCQFGSTAWATEFGFGTACPNGEPRLGGPAGLCLFPVDDNDECGCNNSSFNRPPGPAVDGRVYNERSRYPDCSPVTQNINELHRLSPGCEQGSSTNQIGCIVGSQSCYLGWGGGGMLTANPGVIDGLSIEGQSPLDPDAVTSGLYPLARKLYFNTLSGFDSITDAEEAALAECYDNEVRVAAAISSDGYIPVDDLDWEGLDCSQWD
ncbi:MAG: hypothetical protein B7733_16495 [Myxococcales bacterium FL481]|nr:MAG: hypothetical protein B7733_16495 [Myxococcales bacterium FL481]